MRVSKKMRRLLKEKEGIKLTKEMTNILLEDILELSKGQKYLIYHLQLKFIMVN